MNNGDSWRQFPPSLLASIESAVAAAKSMVVNKVESASIHDSLKSLRDSSRNSSIWGSYIIASEEKDTYLLEE